MDIRIDLNRELGAVRPLHGIDNGPVCFGGLIDSSAFYKVAGFPFMSFRRPFCGRPRSYCSEAGPCLLASTP